MPQDPFIRERLRTAAKKLAAEYFERFPKDRYQTEIESWRHLQSDNIEFTLKRLREPIDADNHGGHPPHPPLSWKHGPASGNGLVNRRGRAGRRLDLRRPGLINRDFSWSFLRHF
jgi:hypothetical protein